MSGRSGWDELRARRMAEPDAQDAYEVARLAFELGRSVRQLREQQGWSQSELARQAGMTQSAVARFEAGGTAAKPVPSQARPGTSRYGFLRRWSGHANTPPSGKGSRAKPVTLGPPVLVPNLSEQDRAAAVAALTDILTAYWSRQQTAADRPDVRPEP